MLNRWIDRNNNNWLYGVHVVQAITNTMPLSNGSWCSWKGWKTSCRSPLPDCLVTLRWWYDRKIKGRILSGKPCSRDFCAFVRAIFSIAIDIIERTRIWRETISSFFRRFVSAPNLTHNKGDDSANILATLTFGALFKKIKNVTSSLLLEHLIFLLTKVAEHKQTASWEVLWTL